MPLLQAFECSTSFLEIYCILLITRQDEDVKINHMSSPIPLQTLESQSALSTLFRENGLVLIDIQIPVPGGSICEDKVLLVVLYWAALCVASLLYRSALTVNCWVIANTQVFALRYRVWSKWIFFSTYVHRYFFQRQVMWLGSSIELSLVHPLAGLQTRNRSLQSKKPVLFYPKAKIVLVG